MAGMIPHHGGDAVARLESDGLECRGELAGAAVEFTVTGVGDAFIWAAREDFDVGKEFARALENGRERELKIHHGTAHALGPSQKREMPAQRLALRVKGAGESYH